VADPGARPIWALLSPQMTGTALRDAVRKLEDRGIAGLVMPQVYGPPFVPLAAAAMASDRLELGTGIAIALTRSPFETACAAIEVDRISEGRFTLGLGVGPRHWVDFFGADYTKPVSRVREVIDVIRHVERCTRNGVMEPYDGEFWQLAFEGYEPTAPPLRERIPIRVAALRERVCELVGECCDGLLGHPMWSVEYALGTAQDAVARGAARAGRDVRTIEFQPYVTASIDRDERRAVELAKPFVAFYGGFAQYLPYYEAHGFGAEARRLAAALQLGSCREAAALVPDEMARKFVACGTPDQVREWIEPLWQRASSLVVLPPSWGLSQAEAAEKQIAIEETLWPS
jgi:alkanesulfonate monooxygenase SsuD/methylene tetrahydromethanopterin reductase-like flavin-dependent oxidoreductase (luciferase family)